MDHSSTRRFQRVSIITFLVLFVNVKGSKFFIYLFFIFGYVHIREEEKVKVVIYVLLSMVSID